MRRTLVAALALALSCTVATVALARGGSHHPDRALSIESASVAPAVISPNGDGQADEATASFVFQVRSMPGFPHGLRGVVETSFVLSYSMTVTGAQGLVRTLEGEIEIQPAERCQVRCFAWNGKGPHRVRKLLRCSEHGNGDFERGIEVPATLIWDGTDGATAVAAGSYALRVEAVYQRIDTVKVPRKPPKIFQRELGRDAADVGTVTVELDQDVVPPTLIVEEPAEGALLGSRSVRIAGTTDDPQALVKVDGLPVPVVDLHWERTVAYPTDGPQTTIVEAEDPHLNVAQPVVRHFVCDGTAPGLSDLTPTDGSWLPSPDVLVGGRVSDATTVSVTIDGEDAPVSEGVFSLPKHLATTDATVVIRATDAVSHATEASPHLRVDQNSPALIMASPLPGRATNDPTPLWRFIYSDAQSGVAVGTFHVELNGADWTQNLVAGPASAAGATPATLPDAIYLVSFSIADQASNVTQVTTYFTIDTVPPTCQLEPANDARIAEATPLLRVSYQDQGAGVCPFRFTMTLDGVNVTSLFQIGPEAALYQVPVLAPLASGVHVFSVTFADRASNFTSASSTFSVAPPPPVPPVLVVFRPTDGTTVAGGTVLVEGEAHGPSPVTAVEVSVAGRVFPASLTDGQFSAEVAVEPGASVLSVTARAANGLATTLNLVIYRDDSVGPPLETPNSGFACGTVLDFVTKQPLRGARVSGAGVWGVILTDAEGRFAFPVDQFSVSGLARFGVDVTCDGYMFAQRWIDVGPCREATLGRIYLMPLDTQQTLVGPEGGQAVSSDGRIVVEFPPGALAEAVNVVATLLPDAEALPAPLPPTSHYTVALDLKPDGLVLAGPAVLKVRNDLQIAPGSPVPLGYYDRAAREWVAEPTGVISDDGQWMIVEIRHFSPYDLNYPLWSTDGPLPEFLGDRSSDERDTKCESGDCDASKVVHRTGNLQEWKTLVGSRVFGVEQRFTLSYDSDHVAPKAFVDIVAAPVPDAGPYPRINGNMSFGGRAIYYDVVASSQPSLLRWVGLATDRFGRFLSTGVYSYSYDLGYWAPATFGVTSQFALGAEAELQTASGTPVPTRVRRTIKGSGTLAVMNNRESSFGAGWSLSGVPRLHPGPRLADPVVLEDGGALLQFKPRPIITPFAGSATWEGWGEPVPPAGAPALEVPLRGPMKMARDAQGTIYFVDGGNQEQRVCKVNAGGTLTVVAGPSATIFDWHQQWIDGEAATAPNVHFEIVDLASTPSGVLYFTDAGGVIGKIALDGTIHRVAGQFGQVGSSGNGGPATGALLAWPRAIAADAHGNIAVVHSLPSSSWGPVIRRIDPAGNIAVFAGTGNSMYSWRENCPATQVDLQSVELMDLAYDPSGNLYVSQSHRIVKITPAGYLTTLAGSPDGSLEGEGIPARQAQVYAARIVKVSSEGVYYLDSLDYFGQLRRLRHVDNAGIVRTVAGVGANALIPFNSYVEDFVLSGSDEIVFSSQFQLFRLRLSDLLFVSSLQPQSFLQRSVADGAFIRKFKTGEVQSFDAGGALLATVDTNGNRSECLYDAQGRLSGLKDLAGGMTNLVYDGAGRVERIVHPQGVETRLTVDGRGDLAAVEDPDGTVTRFDYDDAHRLVRKTGFKGDTTVYRYNQAGQVIQTARSNGESRTYVPDASLGNVISLAPDQPLPRVEDISATSCDALGAVKVLKLDGRGSPLTEIDEAGYSTSYEYNAMGQPTSIRYPDGRVSVMTYDSLGNKLSTQEPAIAAVTRYEYHPTFNRVTAVTDPMGHRTLFELDDRGNVISATDPSGAVTRWVRDTRGLALAVTDPRGNTTNFTYDSSGNVIQVVDAKAGLTVFTRDVAGNVTATTNARGAVTRAEYDAMNRVVAAVDAMNNRTALSYQPGGCSVCGFEDQVTAITDPRGNTSRFEYDEAGRPTKLIDALGNASTRIYDNRGLLTESLDPEGRRQRYFYDPRGLVTEVMAPDGASTLFELDSMGRTRAAVDQVGRRTEYLFDLAGRLTTLRRWFGGSPLDTTFEHDKNGNVTTSTDPLGRQTKHSFDARDLLVATENPANGVTRRSFDASANLVGFTNARGSTWSFDFDSLNRVVKEQDPLGRETRYVHDAVGNVVGKTDAKAQVTQFEFDLANRLTRVTYGDGERADVLHDQNGNRTRIAGAAGLAVDQTFDALNRVNAITVGALQRRLSYAYTPSGRRQAFTIANLADGTSKSTTYQWDPAGRLAAITPWVGNAVEFLYNPDGSRRSAVLPNGLRQAYSYDDLGRLSELTYTTAGNAPLADFRYTFDAVDNVLTQSDSEGQSSFQYDLLDRLTHAQYPDGTLERFGYDPAGNRLRHEDSGGVTDYSYDLADQLLATVGAKAAAYSWDPNGNMLSKTDGAGLTRYVWSARDKLSSVELSDGTSNAYSYYPLSDLRFSKVTKAGVLQRFLHDGPDVVEELDPSNASIAIYLEGLGIDEHLARIAAGGQVDAYVVDRLGTVRGLADAGGGLVNSYAYKAFGEARSAVEGRVNPYRFTGRAFEPDTGEYFFRARYYQPGLGRFSAFDPEPGQISPHYAYARNNPAVYVDPDGRFAFVLAAPEVMLGLIGVSVTTLGLLQNPENKQRLEDAVQDALNAMKEEARRVAAGSQELASRGAAALDRAWEAYKKSQRCREAADYVSDAAGRAWDYIQEMGQKHGKGERGQTKNPSGTSNPGKHYRRDPNNPGKVIYTDPHTGKKVSKPLTPEIDEWLKSNGRGGA